MVVSGEDVDSENCSTVDLGFVEKCENKIFLTSLFYPNKLGGRPAWLRWDSLPSADILKCGKCEKQLVFLCQIYVPQEIPINESSETKLLHRTIYLFCCRNGPCSKFRSFVKAFRTERLQTENDADDDSQSDEELGKVKVRDFIIKMEKEHSLCSLCGCLGQKTCSWCHNVKYCSKDHQTIDWKYRHKRQCNANSQTNQAVIGGGDGSGEVGEHTEFLGAHPLLFNEYDIIIEGEPLEDVSKEHGNYGINYSHEAMKSIDSQLEKDLMKLSELQVDEDFSKFRERIDREPEQVIRYDLGGPPLWISSDNVPAAEDIPNCVCGAARQFEFQVLPQMINYLGVETTIDSIDWGTLCVYTCKNNCQDGDPYKEEFVWKQDLSQSDI